MIRYSLRCDRGHAFESWFQSSSAYEQQEKRKLVNCPSCGSDKDESAIIAPQTVGQKDRESAASDCRPAPAPEAMTAASTATRRLMVQETELRAKLKSLGCN